MAKGCVVEFITDFGAGEKSGFVAASLALSAAIGAAAAKGHEVAAGGGALLVIAIGAAATHFDNRDRSDEQ